MATLLKRYRRLCYSTTNWAFKSF